MKNILGSQKLRRIASLAVSIAVCSIEAEAQTDTVNVPDYFEGGEGTLNRAVITAINNGTLSSNVFKLKPYGYYVLDSTIVVPAGKRLTIVAHEPGSAQQTAPPQIVWSSNGSIDRFYNFDCFGDITLKNIWLLYARVAGNQSWSSLRIRDTLDSINGQQGTFDGAIFDYAGVSADGSGAVNVTSRYFRGSFTNCYFRNCIDQHYRYYGRAVSFPFNSTGWHIDTLKFVNCTFANIGYVIMQEGGEYADYVFMNHCTILNTMMYTLESGWWHWLSMSNSIFVNAFMYGYFPAFLIPGEEQPEGDTIRIDSVARFGFPVPFTDTQRHILFANSSYVIQPWLRQHMANTDPIWYPDTTMSVEDRKPHPQPMMNRRTLAFFDTVVNGVKLFPYISRSHLSDSTDPGFTLPATNEPAIKRFLTMRWTTSEDTNWAFQPQASLDRVWPLPENLAYTNATLLAAGMGGFPLGDLYRWLPQRYAQWKLQEQAENSQISMWLHKTTEDEREDPLVAELFELKQNYPNPFNPTTKIEFRIAGFAFVSLKVLDLLGREVATLANEEMRPGNYRRIFDARRFASGVYFYRLKAGPFADVKKLVV